MSPFYLVFASCLACVSAADVTGHTSHRETSADAAQCDGDEQSLMQTKLEAAQADTVLDEQKSLSAVQQELHRAESLDSEAEKEILKHDGVNAAASSLLTENQKSKSVSRASPGCVKCCQKGDCSLAYNGKDSGMCCNTASPTCCPHYAHCVPGGCKRNNLASHSRTVTKRTVTTRHVVPHHPVHKLKPWMIGVIVGILVLICCICLCCVLMRPSQDEDDDEDGQYNGGYQGGPGGYNQGYQGGPRYGGQPQGTTIINNNQGGGGFMPMPMPIPMGGMYAPPPATETVTVEETTTTTGGGGGMMAADGGGGGMMAADGGGGGMMAADGGGGGMMAADGGTQSMESMDSMGSDDSYDSD